MIKEILIILAILAGVFILYKVGRRILTGTGTKPSDTSGTKGGGVPTDEDTGGSGLMGWLEGLYGDRDRNEQLGIENTEDVEYKQSLIDLVRERYADAPSEDTLWNWTVLELNNYYNTGTY